MRILKLSEAGKKTKEPGMQEFSIQSFCQGKQGKKMSIIENMTG